MGSPVETFKATVARYFEGPDPRNRGIGTVVGSTDDAESRDYSMFQVHNHPNETGWRMGGTPPGAFIGIGQEVDSGHSVVIFARPADTEVLRTWNYISDIETGYENELGPDHLDAAVEYAANPILFSELTIFTGITKAQEQQIAEFREMHEESNRRFMEESRKDEELRRQAFQDTWDVRL